MIYANFSTKPISLSVLGHIALLVLLVILGRYVEIPDYTMVESKKPIHIEQLSKNQFEKLRRLGVKDGTKKFSVETPKNNVAKRISKLTLSELKKALQKASVIPAKQSFKMKKAKAELSLIKRMERRSIPAKKIIKEHQIASPNTEQFKRTAFNIDFIPPEGIKENELNSMEKMFYSFQKRTYLTYFNSFMKSYEELEKIRPKLEKAIRTEDHLLTGRITYDTMGHIVAIKILKWSVNDDVQLLFENTLKRLKLPNPPKALIKEKEFNIYFQLVLNDK